MAPIAKFFKVLFISSILTATFAKPCPPLGRTLPAPQSPSENYHVRDATAALTNQLQEIFTPLLKTSGVSIGVKSLHENASLFNYHFTPPELSGIGTSKINENTIYRVGSVSKIMPALAALQIDKIDMHASVLKYIPDLKQRIDVHPDAHNIRWEDITVDSLASHLSGLPTDTAYDLALFPQGPWTQMGLPAVKPGTGPNCSGLPGTRICSPKDLLDHINRKSAVYNPYTSPVYSNVGFAILGMVIEAATGKKFEDVVKESIFHVADMKSSSFNGPVPSFNEIGFVPKGESTWNLTLGIYEAAGGMFSSTVDLLSFAEAIIGNRLLSPVKTREWMKPRTHTSSFGFSVGAPWEILRSTSLTPDGRLIDVYTKSGDLGLYHALIGIVPDYDISIAVLTGGAEASLESEFRTEIFSAAIRMLLPAIDKASREEASSHGYIGTFTNKRTNSSLTLALDDGPGILIKEFKVRNFDVLSHIAAYSLGSADASLSGNDTLTVEGRLYPADMSISILNHTLSHHDHPKKQQAKSDEGPHKEVFRAVFETLSAKDKAKLSEKLFFEDGSCRSWFDLDRLSYNYLSLAEFQFVRDGNGVIQSVVNEAFGITLSI